MAFPVDQIAGAELLTSAFGKAPSFHDAEVHRVVLERDGKSGLPELVAQVHAFEMTPEVTRDGFYKLRMHTMVEFRFVGIDDLELGGFNGQNALFALDIGEIADPGVDELRWEVIFVAAHGLDASFRCRTITVESALPYEPPPRLANS